MALDKIIRAYQVIRYNRLGFCAFRAQYALRKKTGLLKRKFPVRPWSQITIADWLRPQVAHQLEGLLQAQKNNGRRFFFKSGDLPGLNERYKDEVVPRADEILQNRFQYFFDKNYDLGPGPDWFLNPVTGRRGQAERHWCDVDLFDPNVGDIKFIWEPSRFGWVYTLIRAYAATGDEKYAEKFWSLFESWLENNQPNMGPNYACGQECAIRLMAMCFGLYGFCNVPSSSPQRLTQLALAVAVHADRIEKNIDFAISTNTNHSLTEAAGLYTAGTLFPEFKRSEHWLKLGKKILTNEGLKQIYPDGSYIQHSMNYHRLMLQDFLWVMRLAELNGDSFCQKLVSRVAKAVDFLYQMQDEYSGRSPNYGANDGALIVPLNNCDYLDYRAVIQAGHYLFSRARLYKPGPWDEDLLWFFGSDASEAEIEPLARQRRKYEAGGYYTLRNRDSWAMLRCHSYKDRPGHSDMLHIDLWWKGINVLRDSGSFMYNCAEPWQSYFCSTAAHNTIVADGRDQMRRISRFMWSDWTKSRLSVAKSAEDSSAKIIQGEHYGYRQKNNGIVHRRSVLSLKDAYWLIVDDVLGTGNSQIGLYWQLCDEVCELKGGSLILQTVHGPICLAVIDSAGERKCECLSGDDGPAGWQSLYYGSSEPAPTLVCSIKAVLPVRFVTLVSLGDVAKDLAFGADDTVSWKLDKSGEEFAVGLSSIADSADGTFDFIKHGSKKLNLD